MANSKKSRMKDLKEKILQNSHFDSDFLDDLCKRIKFNYIFGQEFVTKAIQEAPGNAQHTNEESAEIAVKLILAIRLNHFETLPSTTMKGNSMMNRKSAIIKFKEDEQFTIWGIHPTFDLTPLQEYVLSQLDEHLYAPFTLSALASQFNLSIYEVREQLEEMWENGLFQQLDRELIQVP